MFDSLVEGWYQPAFASDSCPTVATQTVGCYGNEDGSLRNWQPTQNADSRLPRNSQALERAISIRFGNLPSEPSEPNAPNPRTTETPPVPSVLPRLNNQLKGRTSPWLHLLLIV